MDIFISDSTADATHGDLVKQSVSLGYGSDISDRIYLKKNPNYQTSYVLNDITEAVNIGYKYFIQSAFGAVYFESLAATYKNDITIFSPAGANTVGEVYHGTIPAAQVITGAGDVANETADNVEFISIDSVGGNEQDYSSFSNGYIAGQILKIIDSLNCSIDEARLRARRTGSQNGIWSETNGFGFINIDAAINDKPIVGSLSLKNKGKAVTITLDDILQIPNYEIQIVKLSIANFSEIITSQNLIKSYNLPSYGTWKFRYRAKSEGLISDWSLWEVLPYNKVDVLTIK